MSTWRAVPEWEGLYEVSDDGRVRSLDRVRRGRLIKGRVLALTDNGRGYLQVQLVDCLTQRGGRRSVHQLVALAFIGPRPTGMQVAHGDGDRLNNAATNLRYATQSENELDKRAHGTSWHINKTHCPQGHPYDEANTKRSRGRRGCRACANASRARAKRRARLAKNSLSVV